VTSRPSPPRIALGPRLALLQYTPLQTLGPRLAPTPPPLHRSDRGNSVRVWGNEPVSPTFFSPPPPPRRRLAEPSRFRSTAATWSSTRSGSSSPTYVRPRRDPLPLPPQFPTAFFGFVVPVNSPSPLRCCPANFLVVGVRF
jgi:hypothetical protein